MSASSPHDKLTDSLERELSNHALTAEAQRPLELGAALRRSLQAVKTVFHATCEGVNAPAVNRFAV